MREEILYMERVTHRGQGVVLLENSSVTTWADEVLGLVSISHLGLSALTRLLQQNLPLHQAMCIIREDR